MTEAFDAVDVIAVKRDGGVLTDAQIDWMIDAYTRGAVAEEQMSALLMAVFLNGLTPGELNRWTAAMIASGETLDFSGLSRPTADKHSTGGVGDKITLTLTPLVACFGVAVPQLSGRGLGHTGGTLDKLEAIPGWQAVLTNQQMTSQLDSLGAVICQAGAGLAPADRKLYALRDVTATVACVPLIASSIMSKKIAEGTGVLVLDVKCGSGAFMADLAHARELAQTMVGIGNDHGVTTRALITDMSTPLGLTAGNGLEVAEAVEVLSGGGPSDVVDLTLALAREMLDATADRLEVAGLPGAGMVAGSAEALRRAGELRSADLAAALKDGRAMDVWRRMIAAQGGDPSAELPQSRHADDVLADTDGFLTSLDALKVGVAAWRLGAGRARKEDVVQAGAGVVMHAKPGEQVRRGQPLLTLHSDDTERFARAREALDGAWTIGDAEPFPSPLIMERIVK